jgi:hypothetical protein
MIIKTVIKSRDTLPPSNLMDDKIPTPLRIPLYYAGLGE